MYSAGGGGGGGSGGFGGSGSGGGTGGGCDNNEYSNDNKNDNVDNINNDDNTDHDDNTDNDDDKDNGDDDNKNDGNKCDILQNLINAAKAFASDLTLKEKETHLVKFYLTAGHQTFAFNMLQFLFSLELKNKVSTRNAKSMRVTFL